MEDIIVNKQITIPAAAVTFAFSRSGGKGGQNVNKVSTKVEVYVQIRNLRCGKETFSRILQALAGRLDKDGMLRCVSQESRSQWQNKQSAMGKAIRMITAAAVRPEERVATKPTRASTVRRVEKKKIIGMRKTLRRKTHPADDE